MKKGEHYKLQDQIWCYKFTRNSNLIKKNGNRKIQKFWEVYLRMKKFGDTEIKKQKIRQHKRRISITNIDINKIVVYKTFFGKKGFKYFICYEGVKIRVHIFSQKWAHVEETLLKLHICQKNIMKFGRTLK